MSESKSIKSQLQELTDKLLTLLSIDGSVVVTSEGDVHIVTIDSPESSGLLIGAHGATLGAIQSFLSMAMRARTGEWVKLSVDIAGWKAKHEEYLVSLAKQAADRAKSTGEPQYLYNLNPAQRRVIHTALSEIGGVKSESAGEGVERYMVVTAS